jgi:hypothetical protein
MNFFIFKFQFAIIAKIIVILDFRFTILDWADASLNQSILCITLYEPCFMVKSF